MLGKMIAARLKKMKLFSKKSTSRIKMALEGPIARHHKESLNLFLTRVKDSLSLYSTKIHSKMTTSTRINRKVIPQLTKNSSK